MMIEVKYFHEKSNEDGEMYSKLWDENKERFIFMHLNLSHKDQLRWIQQDLKGTAKKDILAVRFPEITEIKKNEIINDVILGNGVRYKNNVIWYPKEIWIYHPMVSEKNTDI